MRKSGKKREERPLRIAGYVRVSSQRQATEGDSLLAQQNEIEQEVEFRKRRENLQVESLEFYVDAGKSAKDQNRPQLQRLKRDIAAGKVDLVICFKLDRITRSLKDFVDLWALFAEHEVDVISLREKFDTSMPTGEAMVQLIMVFAQLERKMTAERTFSIMRDRADRGLWNGGHVLGYRSVKDDPGKLEIDPEGAEIVRRIFDKFEELGSAGAVTRHLSDLVIRLPTYRTRADKLRGGNLFTKQKVIGLLRNPIYLGQIRWGDSVREDCHEPIICQQQFDRVQLQIGKMLVRNMNLKKPKGRVYLLSGILRCQCGAHMVGASAHGRTDKNYYYVCTRQNHEGGKYSCNSSRIPAEALENAIIGRISDIGRMVEARDRIVQEALACLGGEAERLREAEDLARRRLAQVHAEIGRLVEVLKSLGARGLASVQTELERLEEEEGQIKKNLTDIAKRQAPVERVSDDAQSFLETWQDIGELLQSATPEEQMQLLQHYIEVIELGAIDREARTGSYAMRLFPEVRPDRGFDFGGGSGPDDGTSGPETTNRAVPCVENGSAVLTDGRLGSHNRPKSSPSDTRCEPGCSPRGEHVP
ncbi:MAG: recombinase family protein [Bacteroidales bacterium]|nr:recombinase family protein [Bacteroidales bacterium]